MDFIYDPSLVLYLPLYELDSASFMSKDAYGHLCTRTGALWRPKGHYFDGIDDFIDCGNATVLSPSLAITIEMWLYPQAITGIRYWVNKWYSDVNDPAYLFYTGGSNIALVIRNSANTANYTLVANATLTANTWYHLVGVNNGTTLYIYVNGQLDNTGAGGAGRSSTNRLYLGKQQNAYLFKGMMGEVRIYNRALSPLEIQHNYLATKWGYR